MIPFANDTVTLYHFAGRDTWTRTLLRGVKWRGGIQVRDANGQYTKEPETHVVIPYSLKPDIRMDAGGRDYFVLGDGKPITGTYTPADLKKDHPEMATIRSIRDNTRSPVLKHWMVVLS